MNLNSLPARLFLAAIALWCLPTSLFAASKVIVQENFSEENSFGKFTPVSNASNRDFFWTRNDFGDGEFLQVNGFGGDEPCDDWLILTDAIDLAAFENPNVRFKFIANFADDDNDSPMALKVSSDYDPATHSDPSDATWETLPFSKRAN